MTARPPFDDDALSPGEQALAARLSALDAGAPSAELDARILAAARDAAGPAQAGDPWAARDAHARLQEAAVRTPSNAAAARGRFTRRLSRRWPTAIGAAATLVIAVGLAWQLKPLVDLPPPLRRPVEAASTDAEILAQADPVPRSAAAPPPPVAEADTAAAPPPAAMRAPAARTPAPAARTERVAKSADAGTLAIAPPPGDYVDEAVGDVPEASAAAAPSASPELAEARSSERAGERDRVDAGSSVARGVRPAGSDAIIVSGTRVFPPVQEDASLPPIDWLQRIRDRRDAGDADSARASLRAFVREYPRRRLPDDLRPLLAAPR